MAVPDRATLRRLFGQVDAVQQIPEPVAAEQGSLFAHLDPDSRLARETRSLALSQAMDRLNARFGRNAVTLGPLAGGRADQVGTKIAFGRIPELAEFHE